MCHDQAVKQIEARVLLRSCICRAIIYFFPFAMYKLYIQIGLFPLNTFFSLNELIIKSNLHSPDFKMLLFAEFNSIQMYLIYLNQCIGVTTD